MSSLPVARTSESGQDGQGLQRDAGYHSSKELAGDEQKKKRGNSHKVNPGWTKLLLFFN